MKKLEYALTQMNIPYDDFLIDQFKKYMQGILEWNEKVNLTSISDPDDFIKKHYIDSLLCVNCKEFQQADSIIDVGTGGGFPGVPLALAAPDKEFLLIDSLNKRIKIINELCRDIGIQNITAVHGRAEELARKKIYREKYDLCVSRAVANITTLSEYCLPFIRKGGWFLAYKGSDMQKELQSGKKAIRILGGKIVREEKVSPDEFELNHKIIFINKIRNTPEKFPRKAGTPSKEPLV